MRVLVFGGTQFMGRLTVEGLLDAGHEVVLLNRGQTTNPFEGRPRLKCVKCDRMGDRERFKQAVREQGASDVVIDFIGFQEAYLQDSIEALTLASAEAGSKARFATKHYIFLSTDSVYWAQKVPVTDQRVTEGDAQDFSPPEFERHLERCQKTSLGEYQLRYGGNKLGCERILEEANRVNAFPYTILRLPDAFGPYDNLGGFWELVSAIEMRRPIASNLQPERVRTRDGEVANVKQRRFTWAFADDVRDAILACMSKGVEVQGITMHIGHEEAVDLRETATMIAEAMDVSPEVLRFDDRREAALPSTDYGALDVSRALRLLRPWRPTTMRMAVKRAVCWFLSSKENRRYHRLVHREPRHYDEAGTRRFTTRFCAVPSCWVGSLQKADLVREGPVVLNDSLPDLTGQAVLNFMQRLMDQAGEVQVACELQKVSAVERQTWALRHFGGHLLPQSEHNNAYRLETTEVLTQTDLIPELHSPIGDLRTDIPGRVLCLGGAGARTTLRRVPADGGFWDCALLGRRKWRFFPPDTPPSALCVDGNAGESAADCFICGPDAAAVQVRHSDFAPATCWECEQTMGDAIFAPCGWWYQTYDDDRTLSISGKYGGLVAGAGVSASHAPQLVSAGSVKPLAQVEEEEPEVIEFELVD